MIPTQVLQWVIFGLTLAVGILGIVLDYLQKTTAWTPTTVISLVIAILMFVLTFITKKDVSAGKLAKKR